ncbi:TPA: DUF1643 domain-containing protein [Clostridioides difficile]|nr:DUF1643 domain-containing protein [Clostridioides difficile]HBF4062805.1 DUF1643 domain-containing protein [Clostridioides difficile]
MQEWVYENDDENLIRYVLGTVGDKTLLCFGVNPSTASPNNLDNTLKKIHKIALFNDYDSWIMFNVYPKRDTKFDNLPDVHNDEIHIKNIEKIKNCFDNVSTNNESEISVWLAFGNHIYERGYLASCLKDIYNAIKDYNISWFTSGLNKSGSPKHPLYQKDNTILEEFKMDEYILTLK